MGKVHSGRGGDVGKPRLTRNEERMMRLLEWGRAREASSHFREPSQIGLQRGNSLFGLDPSVDDPADHREPLTLHEHIDRVSGQEVAPPLLGLRIRHEND